MLMRAKGLLSLLLQRPTLLHRPRASFATRRWNKPQFLKKLEKEIIDSQSQIIIDDPQNEAYFKNKGWSIHYQPHKTLFCFTRTTPTRQARVLVYVKDDPPNTDEQDPASEPPEQPAERLNYSQAGIYIRRRGEQKWLTAEMAVMEGAVELMGVFFTCGEPDFSWEKGVYPGPQLKTLPEGVLGAVQWLLEDCGLSTETLMNMVILASNKVDQLDLQWLKDLRDIWSEG